MTVWQNPNKTKGNNVWKNPNRKEKKEESPRKPFPGEGLALGLGQWAEDTFKGLTSHGADPEVDIPDFLRHKKLQSKPEVNRSPSLGLEEYVDPEQKLQFNVGRYGPDILGAGVPAAKGLASAASKLGSKSIGKNIVKDVKDLKKTFKDEYNSIFDAAESKGVKNINSKTNKADLEKILGEVDSKYYKGIQKFIDNPTARNAHFAQSDLGKFVRKMEGKRELAGSEHDALKIARKTQDILKNEVYSSLLKQGGLDLPFKYQDVTNKYKQQMVPYLENSAVRRAGLNPGQKGYIKPERLPGKLKLESSDPLMAHLRGKNEGTKTPINPDLYGKYPLLEANQVLGPLLKYGAIGGVGYTGYDLIKSLMGNR